MQMEKKIIVIQQFIPPPSSRTYCNLRVASVGSQKWSGNCQGRFEVSKKNLDKTQTESKSPDRRSKNYEKKNLPCSLIGSNFKVPLVY